MLHAFFNLSDKSHETIDMINDSESLRVWVTHGDGQCPIRVRTADSVYDISVWCLNPAFAGKPAPGYIMATLAAVSSLSSFLYFIMALCIWKDIFTVLSQQHEQGATGIAARNTG